MMEWRKMVDRLAFDAQGLAAGRQDEDPGRLQMNLFGEARYLVDDVLAVVEHDQKVVSPEKSQQAGNNVCGLRDQADGGCDHRRYKVRACQRPEIDEGCACGDHVRSRVGHG
jgi:hypothetical protein